MDAFCVSRHARPTESCHPACPPHPLRPSTRSDALLLNCLARLQWADASKIACMDPYGHDVVNCWGDLMKKGYDIRPTIAVTKAHIDVPEITQVRAALGRPPLPSALPSLWTSSVATVAEPPHAARRGQGEPKGWVGAIGASRGQ